MWDQRYAGDDFVYGTEPNDFLRVQAEQLPPGKALCLAEGEGRNAVYLASLGWEATAVDASSVGLDKARRLAAERAVDIHCIHSDLAHLQIEPASWDLIVSIFCHVPEAIRCPLHQQVVQGLKPGGHFILEAYRPEQLEFGTGGPPVVELMQTLDSLHRELEGLEFLHAENLVREVHEGWGHTGAGAVVQILARRP